MRPRRSVRSSPAARGAFATSRLLPRPCRTCSGRTRTPWSCSCQVQETMNVHRKDAAFALAGSVRQRLEARRRDLRAGYPPVRTSLRASSAGAAGERRNDPRRRRSAVAECRRCGRSGRDRGGHHPPPALRRLVPPEGSWPPASARSMARSARCWRRRATTCAWAGRWARRDT